MPLADHCDANAIMAMLGSLAHYRKIPAIKVALQVMHDYGMDVGLKNAKELVEELMEGARDANTDSS